MQNPFPGPRPILPGEPIYGRNREIAELRQLLVSERLVLLHSPSGAGKTSLINAGIVPEFTARFHVCPPTRIEFEMPGAYARPVKCSAVAGYSPSPGSPLSEQPLTSFIDSLPRDRNTFLILDHFEATIRAALANPGWHIGFFRQLGQLLNDPTIWALISLREDFVAPILPLLDFIPTRLRARFRLNPLTVQTAAVVMQESARAAGPRIFAPGAAERLATSLSIINIQNPDGSFTRAFGDAVEPLQLQVVCRRLWEGMPEEDLSIDPSDVDEFGDLNSALGDYYEQSLRTLTGGDPLLQRSIREWFDQHLINPGAIRGQVRRGHGNSEGIDNASIEQLLETHLVRAEIRGSVTWYELAHDALIGPILSANKRWYEANLSPCQRAAVLWLENGKSPAFLFTGAVLADAELWFKANFFLATTTEIEFLELSRRQQEALDREAELRRRLVRTVLSSQLQRAADAPSPAAALAHLAYALRVDPSSRVVRARIFDLLQNATWWLPLAPFDAPEPIAIRVLSPSAALAVAGNDEFADHPYTRLWDTGSGRPVDNQPAFPGRMDSGAISANGRFLATVPPGVQLYDLARTPPTFIELPQPSAPFRAIFSPDSSLLLVLTFGGDPATLWDTASAQRIGQPLPNAYRAVFSADSSKLITRSEGSTAQVWDARTAQPIGDPIVHSDRILDAIFVPGTDRVLLSSQGTKVRTWPDGEGLPNESPASMAKFSDDTSRLACLHGNVLRLWSSNGGTYSDGPAISLEAPLFNLYFTPDNRSLVVWLRGDAPAMVFDVTTGQSRPSAWSNVSRLNPVHNPAKPHLFPMAREARAGFLSAGFTLAGPIESPMPGCFAAWSGNGEEFAVADSRTVQRWNAATGELLGQPISIPNVINCLAYSPVAPRLLIGSEEIVQLTEPAVQLIHQHRAFWSEWSRNGLRVITRDLASVLRLWDAQTGALIAEMPAPDGCLSFHPDGAHVLARATLWDVAANLQVLQYPAKTAPFLSGISPDGSTVFTVEHGLLTLWDSHMQPIEIPQGDEIVAAAFSPGSQSLFTQTEKHQVEIWCAKSGARIGNPIVPNVRLSSVSFSPCGTYILTLSHDGPAQLWDASSGLPATLPFPSVQRGYSTAFSPDGSQLLIAGSSMPTQLRTIYREGDPEQLAQLAEAFSGQTLNVHDAVIPLPDQHMALRNLAREAEPWIQALLPDYP